MKISFLLALTFFVSLVVYPQQKEMSISDAIMGQYTYLAPSELRSLQWRNDDSYVFVKNDTLWQNFIKWDKEEVILTLKELNQTETSFDTPFKSFPSFSFLNENKIKINHEQQLIIFDLNEKMFTINLLIPEEAENLDFFNKTRQLAYTKGNNLYILNIDGEKQITHETKPEVLCGQPVHRQEFGITKGTFWSSTGKYIAFYRKDESMVTNYPLVDYTTREAEEKLIKYPMAGMTSHQVTVGIYNLETGDITYLNTGQPDDHYLTNISWGPNDQFIYMAELNRGQDHMLLNQYSVATGEKTNTLFEETASTYVEPQHPIVFSKANPDQFYYWSRKDGWFHIYQYNTDGTQLKQITKGNWEVTDFYGFDDKEKSIYIQSTQESPIDRQIYKVDIATGRIQKLSNTNGTHEALFAPNKQNFIDRWEADDVAGKTDIVKANGKLVRNIHESENTLAEYKLGENKRFTIKADDGNTDLYCRMILPNDFDPLKKYPVIVYVYGGPHVQLIKNLWHNNANWWQYYMASEGYIAFTVDNRGSDNRGQDFEDVIHRQLGIEETTDQMKGIEYLKSLSYVDSDRIGVHGWSYGGFMTLNLMLREANTFKVGVAGGSVIDWEMYEVMYGERYMDTPDENPEGYKNTSMLNHVKKLGGKLMLIHGVQDETVVMQHSMKFLRECIEQNKQVDFFAYPTHPHNVRGKDRIHLMTKVSQYFFDNL